MKLIILLSMFTLSLTAPPAPVIFVTGVVLRPFDRILNATAIVETNNDSTAVGDKHLKLHSYGKYQIRQSRLDDFNKSTGKHYTTKDMFCVKKAREVFFFYCTTSDMEVIAKKWNGGTKGMEKQSTEKYWTKIKKEL
jgi:hypothetical protein